MKTPLLRRNRKRKRRNMKRKGILLGLVLVLGLCGCGEKKQSLVDSEQELEKAEPVTELPEELSLNTETEQVEPVDKHPYDLNICYTGDISLAEDAITTYNLENSGGKIEECIALEFIQQMQEADVTVINNEFQFSSQGYPLEGKMYTFRGNPERVETLKELGVDLACLANNHVYDFGQAAMLDTFDTLQKAGIPYMGAGHNLEEAMTPVYMELQGKKVAFVAASRAEKFRMTPQATETEPGILRCYDTELFLQEIQEAKKNADLVIAYVHWGTEHSTVLEEAQTSTGKEYIDAGADVVVGAHSHCLQGIEYYKGKPILYSLGNFWFDEYTEKTVLLKLHFYGDDDEQGLTVQLVPGLQTGGKTCYLSQQEEQRALYDYMEAISVNASVDDQGFVYEK